MKVQIGRLDQKDQATLSGLAVNGENERLLRQCLRLSAISWVGMVDEALACVWGLVPPTIMSDQAYLWLHTTEIAEAHQFLLVRYSQIMIKQMLEEFPTLVGHCRTDAARSIRWLRWLGAKFGEPQVKGIPFTIRKQ